MGAEMMTPTLYMLVEMPAREADGKFQGFSGKSRPRYRFFTASNLGRN